MDEEELNIKVGDLVIFECGAFDTSRPRWHFNDDLGPSDIWASGEVTFVDDEIIQVEYTIKGYLGKGHCTWPNINHEDYDPLQWFQDGYLTVTAPIEEVFCECGGDKLKITHSHWCPKYD